MKRWILIFVVAAVMMLVEYSRAGQESAAAEPVADTAALPIRKVVLYNHGVGYFERRGSFQGGHTVRLYFKKDQMNDLLKSLTVLDLNGSPINSIVYESTRTAEQALQDYNFVLGSTMGLPQILSQLQGSEAEVSLGDKRLRGRIAGVEEREMRKDRVTGSIYYLVVLDKDGRLESIAIDEVTGLRLLDEKLQKDVQSYLETLFLQHRRDEKMLMIQTPDQGTHDVLVSYVTETPIWKATYRIILPGEQPDKKPFLQGWAAVDNVSEEDWDNIKLSLVSGLPISFVQNLYDPIYKERPVIAVQEETAVSPVAPEEGMTAVAAPSAEAPSPESPRPAAAAPAEKTDIGKKKKIPSRREYTGGMMGGMGGGMGMGMGGGMGGGYIEPTNIEEEMRQIEAETVTREVGDLFEYTIAQPVTVAKNHSALIPIVAREVGGEAVSLYNEATRAKNPLSAVRLKNTTGLTLEGGPLTVYQGEQYVGEALMKTVKPDEQRYITYAVDLGLAVDTKQDSGQDHIFQVTVSRGVMLFQHAIEEIKNYTLNNKDPRDKIVVIEHPNRPDWKLLDPEKPLEVTDNFKRFEVKAAANQVSRFTVKERRTTHQSVQVGNLTPQEIHLYFQSKYITEETRRQLEAIAAAKAEIAELDRKIQDAQKNRDAIFKDQERLRQNLASLRDTAEERSLRSRYIKQMETQENQLGEIDSALKTLQSQREDKQKQMEMMIGSLEQDVKLQ
jgi:hypothetical protein